MDSPRSHAPHAPPPPPPPPFHGQRLLLEQRLSEERKINAEMKVSIETETKARLEKIYFEKGIKLFKKEMELEQKNQALIERETQVKAQEAQAKTDGQSFAVAQRQFKYAAEAKGISTLTEAERNYERTTGRNEGYANAGKHEARLQSKLAQIQLAEKELQFREDNWKEQTRLEFENMARDEITKEVSSKIGTESYRNGFQDGKNQNLEDAVEKARKTGHAEGYQMAFRVQSLLIAIQNGTIDPKHPEVAFLFDLHHPHHPYNLGLEVGQLGLPSKLIQDRPYDEQLSTTQPIFQSPKKVVNRTQIAINDDTTNRPYAPDVPQKVTEETNTMSPRFLGMFRPASQTRANTDRAAPTRGDNLEPPESAGEELDAANGDHGQQDVQIENRQQVHDLIDVN